MPISASKLVQVLPRILKATGKDLVFNGVVLDTNETLKADTPVAFYSPDEVLEYFGSESDQYKFASIYFGGFDNSQVKPQTLFFYRLTPDGAAPFVRGEELKPSDALTAIKAISAGTLSLNVNGSVYELSGIDLSDSTSLSNAGTIVQDAINNTIGAESGSTQGVTVTFSSQFNAFTVESIEVGEEKTLKDITGTVADAFGLSSEAAVVSEGQNPANITESMTNLTQKYQNFVTFTTLAEPTDEDAIALATWATTQATAGVLYLYVCWDSSKANLDINNTSVIAEQLTALNLGATCVCYPNFQMAAFIMGITASIAWDQANSTITYAFKSVSGLPATVESTKDSNALDAHRVNYIGDFATRNDNFVMSYNGSMIGEWDWTDTYINAIWLCNATQVQLVAMLKSANRIPYTEAGYAKIRANVKDVLERAINNGVIDKGVNLSNAQKAELTTLLGADYSQEIYLNGYYLQIIDATAQIRQERKTPSINLVYTYGGAIHKLVIPATAVV